MVVREVVTGGCGDHLVSSPPGAPEGLMARLSATETGRGPGTGPGHVTQLPTPVTTRPRQPGLARPLHRGPVHPLVHNPVLGSELGVALLLQSDLDDVPGQHYS